MGEPETNQKALLFEIEYPEVEDKCRPRHRFMSAYEQKIDTPDNKFQYLLFVRAVRDHRVQGAEHGRRQKRTQVLRALGQDPQSLHDAGVLPREGARGVARAATATDVHAARLPRRRRLHAVSAWNILVSNSIN